jgi:uncharacterized protein YjbI with pentapeptide repeats
MIKNNNLEIYLSNYFGKNIKEISKEELESLEEVSLDGLNIENEYEIIDFKEIMNLFPNLNRMTISNYVLTKENMNDIAINNIVEYSFYKCDFKSISNFDTLEHAKILMFENCILNNYDFINDSFENLEVLCISNPVHNEEVNLLNINSINLKELYLEKCIVNNFKAITKFQDLEFVNIQGTDINKIELLQFTNLVKLEAIVIDEINLDNEIKEIMQENEIEIITN